MKKAAKIIVLIAVLLAGLGIVFWTTNSSPKKTEFKRYVETELVLWLPAVFGDRQAEYRLGYFYASSPYDGNSHDFVSAEKWFLKAAIQGDEPSERALGYIYANGGGVAQNWKKSYFWNCVALKCFNLKTKGPRAFTFSSNGPFYLMMDPYEAANHLTATEVSAIQKQSAEWKPLSAVPEFTP